VAGGRERGGIHRPGWFHRSRHKRSPTYPAGTADVAHPGADAPDEAGSPTSLDQVLRRAAEARDAEHDPDD
jgi:hypothetical protein